MTKLDLYRAAIKRWGEDEQLDLACEEAAEFIQARSHFRRRKPDSINKLREETADLLIMADQAREILGQTEVDRIVEEKLARLAKRVGDETYQVTG